MWRMNGNIFMLRVGNMNEKNVSSWYISVVETLRMKTTAKTLGYSHRLHQLNAIQLSRKLSTILRFKLKPKILMLFADLAGGHMHNRRNESMRLVSQKASFPSLYLTL